MPDPSPTGPQLADEKAVDNCFRYALNELRAIAAGEDIQGDRRIVAIRLRALALHIENGGQAPCVLSVINEACRLPIQH